MSDPVLSSLVPPPIPDRSKLGVASMVLGLFALIAATASIYFLFQSEWDRGFRIAVTAISFLIGLASALMGLTGLFGKVAGRGFAAAGVFCGALALVALAFAVLSIPVRSLLTTMQDLPVVAPEDPHFEIAPIQLTEGARTAAQVREAWRVWLLEHAIQPKKAAIAGKWNEEITGRILDAYLADWIRASDRPTQEDWNRLHAELNDVRLYGEPLSSLLLAGKAQVPRDLAALNTPIGLLRKNEKNPFWLLLLELQSAEAYTGQNNAARKELADQGALDAFEQMIEEKWFTGDEWWLLADLTTFGNFPGFFERQSEFIVEILENNEVPEWFLRYMRGRRFQRLAWKARGSGYSNTVTEEGWKDFAAYLDQARGELERSYELAPEVPFAASRMISVAMGRSDDPVAEMRTWFDRAIAAQSDFWPAYNDWLWGMRPRWHGSHEAMLAFGEHCLATGRHDTRVPNHYLAAVKEVAEDSDNGIYQDERVYRNLRQLCLGEIEHADDPRTVREWRSLLAVLAFRKGEFDETREQWNLLKGEMEPSVLTSWGVPQENFDFRAIVGVGSDLVNEADTAERARHPGEAAKLYERAAQEPGITEAERSAIQRRQAICTLESQFESGDWIELIPGSPDLWRAVEGGFTVAPDGGMIVTSDTARCTIEHPMVVGQHCEIEWEIDTPDDQIAAIGPGIMLSSSRFDTIKWNAFYVGQVDGERSYKVSRFRYRSDMFERAPKKERIQMRLVCHGSKWLAYVDGEKIHRGEIDLNVSFFGKESRLAIGAFTTNPTDKFVIKYHRLRVRKLPAPETGEKSGG